MLIEGNWSLLSVAFLMVLYVAQGGVLLSSLVHLSLVSGARWRSDIAPFAHQTVHLYPLALLILIILLAVPDATFPYYQDSSLHLNAWHNFTFLATREVLFLLIVAAFHYGFVYASVRHKRENTEQSRKRLTLIAAGVPFLYFIYGTMVSWDFEMTLRPGWHSPMYAPYFFVSNFQMFLGFFVVVLYLQPLFRRGSATISNQSFNYLAQMLLGLTLLWVYTFYFQFLTIWYGNLPHETGRLFGMIYKNADVRQGEGAFASYFWWYVILKALVPFTLLIFALVRHSPLLTALVGGIIFFGTFLERFTWTASAHPSWQTPLTSWFDIGVVLVVFALGFVAWRLAIRYDVLQEPG